MTTYSQPQYDLDLFDAATLKSASVIKAKFKIEDVVRENLCLSEMPRKQCKDINIKALEGKEDATSVLFLIIRNNIN